MKQIFNNQYIKCLTFLSYKEQDDFIRNIDLEHVVRLQETYGSFYYCIVIHDSLTKKKKQLLSFSSDFKEDSLYILFWDDIIVLSTGNFLYFINNNLEIISVNDITTPLVGLFLTKKNSLLVLEEAAMNLYDTNGNTILKEIFDLIENFFLTNETLIIHCHSDTRTILL